MDLPNSLKLIASRLHLLDAANKQMAWESLSYAGRGLGGIERGPAGAREGPRARKLGARLKSLPPDLRSSGRMRPRSGWIGWAALVLGANCDRFPVYLTTAYLANRTRDPLEVRVLRAPTSLDCRQLATTPAQAMTAAFTPGFCQVLQPGYAVPLDRTWWSLGGRSPRVTPTPGPPGCEAAVLRVAGLPDTLLVWQRREFVQAYEWVGSDALDRHGLYLERANAQLFAAGTPLIVSMPITVPLPETRCAEFPALAPAGDVANLDARDGGNAP
jgi:hypothetical protein